MKGSRVRSQMFSSVVLIGKIFLVASDLLTSIPPDFMDNFKESLLTIASHDEINFIDLSARNACYKGDISFRKSTLLVKNTSCNSSGATSLVTCTLSDGQGVVNLTLELFKDCERLPGMPTMSEEEKSLHLQIWVPIVGIIILGLLIGLGYFAFERCYLKRESHKSFSGEKKTIQPDFTILQTQIMYTSTDTNVTTISNSPESTSFSPNLSYSRCDSAFSSMKTLETIPEDEGSITTSSLNMSSESSCDLKIIHTRSTNSLNEVILLDIEINNESSTDATMKKVKVTKTKEKKVMGTSNNTKM